MDNVEIGDPDTVVLRDSYSRLMADFENYKRHNILERQRLIETAEGQLIGELIDIKDNFKRAFNSGDRGDAFVDGIQLNYAKLDAILKNHGLEAFGDPGTLFNPELHDALICTPSDSIPESYISDVLEQGYTLKGKIIKHAKVAVSSGKIGRESVGPPLLSRDTADLRYL